MDLTLATRRLWTELLARCLAVRPKRMRTLLYRRIVEIRDARLRLRPWFDDETSSLAQQQAANAGLSGIDADAAVEAAVLRAALAAHAAADTPRQTGISNAEPTSAEARWLDKGDLAAESRWLGAVARQYARLAEGGADPASMVAAR